MENIKSSFMIGLLTFFISIMVTISSQAQLELVSLFPAAIILLVIVFAGVIGDMIGVAATAANENTFNARAAKKVFGARESLYLVKHADRVASLMCDIIGDICGTVSGATSVIILIRIVDVWDVPRTPVNLVIIGLVTSLTVGGKAFFKTYGMKKADSIIFFVGKILAGISLVWKITVDKLRGES